MPYGRPAFVQLIQKPDQGRSQHRHSAPIPTGTMLSIEIPGGMSCEMALLEAFAGLGLGWEIGCHGFRIISRDAGFDPLIKHLKGKKIFAQRSIRIADIPYFKPALPATEKARIDAAIADLVRRKAGKPRTQKTLLGTLHALFKKELTEQQLTELFNTLRDRGLVIVEGNKVSYDLPTQA